MADAIAFLASSLTYSVLSEISLPPLLFLQTVIICLRRSRNETPVKAVLISVQVIVDAQVNGPSHRHQPISMSSPPHPAHPSHAARLQPFRRTDSFQPAFPPQLLAKSRASGICFSFFPFPFLFPFQPRFVIFSPNPGFCHFFCPVTLFNLLRESQLGWPILSCPSLAPRL
ncbi:hypothetical protein BO86DRAFT_244758 [Aspergillus japonicus CBS 114.51]|uniref:Uncharacterized protein n=1 Tax=Aspergillus japonicus CBS 114.51 TaxID=1448312 RepID=A0A8T8X919_ASPJA|nr:hypothetical protein BO86DRAFT_244758 [Aspergillus japonicus CBS 114.51]RAH84500.1 hypothetical protein BO86DRAFT_244758 [Aspergillus japonicus CBS 114.51]